MQRVLRRWRHGHEGCCDVGGMGVEGSVTLVARARRAQGARWLLAVATFGLRRICDGGSGA